MHKSKHVCYRDKRSRMETHVYSCLYLNGIQQDIGEDI